MDITGILGGADCPNGDDCDFVYDTDDPEEVLVRGRWVNGPVTDSSTGEPIRLPAHEGLLRVKRAVFEAGAS